MSPAASVGGCPKITRAPMEPIMMATTVSNVDSPLSRRAPNTRSSSTRLT